MTGPKRRPDRRSFLGMTAAAALAAPGIACGDTAMLERILGRAFGTVWTITAPSGSRLESLRPRIEALLAEIDRQMSPWRRDSEVTAVNRARAGVHAVSAETATVCNMALGIAQASGGLFDPTVGPLVARWGFGPIEGERTGDWRDLSVSGMRIGKVQDGTTLDLCGIAKGWALDRITDLMAEAGHSAALIDIGGELRGFGRHPSGRVWQVAVEDPLGSGSAVAALTLSDRAVATSGLIRHSYSLNGRDYGHIVDPRNGMPATGALRSVSVVQQNAVSADAWATALFAAGAQAGPTLAQQMHLSALFLIENEGHLTQNTTGDMPGLLL